MFKRRLHYKLIPAYAGKRSFEGVLNIPDIHQILETLRMISPLLSPLAWTLFHKRHDIFGGIFSLANTTVNYCPRLAADHYLSIMDRITQGDASRWIKLEELADCLCDGALEIGITLKYLKHKGWIEFDKNNGSPIVVLTEKGVKQARKATARFQLPNWALAVKTTKIERLASRMNAIAGRKW
jgi:Mn-dependent DtxR family transcriptional regulator